MGAPLPSITLEEFAQRLGAASLPAPAVEALHRHYLELRRWNATTSLVGPGTVATAPERHYLESLAALPWIPEGALELVDIGSGAGFPGWVLAAARPDLRVTLFEPRSRKAAFLRAAAQAAGLKLAVSGARVFELLPVELPHRIDILTMRAVKLDRPTVAGLADRIPIGGRWLRWTSGPQEDAHRTPEGFRRLERRRGLPFTVEEKVA